MAEFTEVKDSGTRHQFVTGAVRDIQEGKGRFDLISTRGLRRLAKHYENGARKYSERNWEKGMKLSAFINSATRHMLSILEGDHSEDHEAAWVWNAIGFLHTAEMINEGKLPKELDDVNWTVSDVRNCEECSDSEAGRVAREVCSIPPNSRCEPVREEPAASVAEVRAEPNSEATCFAGPRCHR